MPESQENDLQKLNFRKMKKLMMFVLVALCATLVVNQATASGKENLKGIWEYKVPNAPYDYSKGKLIFGEVNGQTTITVKLMSGTEIKAQNVKVENDTISFGVMIEYNLVKCNGKVVNGKITGKVDSPEGIMDLTAERPKQ